MLKGTVQGKGTAVGYTEPIPHIPKMQLGYFTIPLRQTHLFFSSRRRHTRCGRDWSSDVCSSDLTPGVVRAHGGGLPRALVGRGRPDPLDRRRRRTSRLLAPVRPDAPRLHVQGLLPGEIGRASCRERVRTSAAGASAAENAVATAF